MHKIVYNNKKLSTILKNKNKIKFVNIKKNLMITKSLYLNMHFILSKETLK